MKSGHENPPPTKCPSDPASRFHRAFLPPAFASGNRGYPAARVFRANARCIIVAPLPLRSNHAPTKFDADCRSSRCGIPRSLTGFRGISSRLIGKLPEIGPFPDSPGTFFLVSRSCPCAPNLTHGCSWHFKAKPLRGGRKNPHADFRRRQGFFLFGQP